MRSSFSFFAAWTTTMTMTPMINQRRDGYFKSSLRFVFLLVVCLCFLLVGNQILRLDPSSQVAQVSDQEEAFAIEPTRRISSPSSSLLLGSDVHIPHTAVVNEKNSLSSVQQRSSIQEARLRKSTLASPKSTSSSSNTTVSGELPVSNQNKSKTKRIGSIHQTIFPVASISPSQNNETPRNATHALPLPTTSLSSSNSTHSNVTNSNNAPQRLHFNNQTRSQPWGNSYDSTTSTKIMAMTSRSMLAYPLALWNTTISHNANNITRRNNKSARNSLHHHQHEQQQHSPPLLRIFVYEPQSLQPSPMLADIYSCAVKVILDMESPSQWNFHADLALMNLFQTYPGRTYNPNEADLFVVPYPHASHCMLGPCRPKRQQMNNDDNNHTNNSTNTTAMKSYGTHCPAVDDSIIRELLSSLTHLRRDPQKWDRHLFLLSADLGLLKPVLERMPLILTIGYQETFDGKDGGGRNGKRKTRGNIQEDKILQKYNPRKRTSGKIVVPYLNDHPWFRPSVIMARDDDWWTTNTSTSTSSGGGGHQRKYSFVYFFGASNKKLRKKRDARRFRREFADSVRSNHPNGTLAGLPYILEELPSPSSSSPSSNITTNRRSPEDVYRLYQDSTLCPCLPGDAPIQKRFFDVMMNGCLPVVLRFPPTRRGSNANETYWHPWETDIRRVYPYFATKKNDTSTTTAASTTTTTSSSADVDPIWIDYESFVIQVDIPIDTGAVERAMEAILLNNFELLRRQRLLQRYAPLFSYGMGPDAHQYNDAFSQIEKLLYGYVRELEKEKR